MSKSTSSRSRTRSRSRARPTGRVRVEAFTAFADASGAAAKMSWDGYVFVFSLAGVVKASMVRIPPGGSTPRAKVGELLCTRVFLTLLERAVDVEWLERNARMSTAWNFR